ncbi:hypothetical protein SDC9_209143 [bioreactor metagenome]|uniref:Uncharacterized protein n=1 Tax=bioreactor metagenome TaxID=1076179 RepID=A0A645JD76_9ZZZZ
MLCGLVIHGNNGSAGFAVFFTDLKTDDFVVVELISGEFGQCGQRQINVSSDGLVHQWFGSVFKGNDERVVLAPGLFCDEERHEQTVDFNKNGIEFAVHFRLVGIQFQEYISL